MPDIGPYSRPSVLAKLDGRTREARLMQTVRDDLTAHIGGNPTATQKALIDRAAWLQLHVSLMDAKTLDDGGPLSERDSRQYLAWSNALTRIMRDLGADKPRSKPKRSLQDLLAEGVAA
ncbi:hypothetical protein [Rhizobium mongolense]|uniref:Uncharacterized protein n=1 Tax=Rhizobium mongolense TaxID=57676 RepID=A0A7W6WCB6_9HYPH|nr:hypothetical protein [Rhizobium mongolense]MBB4272333.1 hypothetical protein [Rhizobium mongolense]